MGEGEGFKLNVIATLTIDQYFIQNFTHELFNIRIGGEAWSRYIQDSDGVCFGKGEELGAPPLARINVQAWPVHLVRPFLSRQRSPS